MQSLLLRVVVDDLGRLVEEAPPEALAAYLTERAEAGHTVDPPHSPELVRGQLSGEPTVPFGAGVIETDDLDGLALAFVLG